jgi:hypothetical protein
MAATATAPKAAQLREIFSDPHLYLCLLNRDVADIVVDRVTVEVLACRVCKRVHRVSDLNWYHGHCTKCADLTRWGAYSKVWKPEHIPEVAERVKAIYSGIEERIAVKEALNKSARWDNCGKPVRLLRNADLDIPPATRKRRR